MDKWLTHNNFAKVLALVISIMLWAMVHLDSGSPVSPTTVVNNKVIDNVKIQVTGFDDKKYVLYDLEPSTVRLEVKGKRTDITTDFSDYKVKLNLENVGPGTFTLPLTHELPPGVQLVSMDPSIVKVTIEAKETKKVPVTIVTKGEPADGLLLGTPIISGDSDVEVTLPESELNDLDKVQGTIDVTGLKDSIKGKAVKLVAYDKQGQVMQNAEISPSSVDVEVPINKMYKNVPIELHQTGRLPAGYVLAGIETDVEGVALYGTKGALDGITAFPLTVDLGRFDGSEETKYSVDLTPPDGFEKIEPSSVTITLKVKPGGQKQVDNIPITLEHENPLYDVKFLRPSDRMISLTVLGAEDALSRVGPDQIKVTADISHLGVGVHTVPVTVKLPSYVELSDQDKSAEIQIEILEKGKPASTNSEGQPANSADNQGPNPSGNGEEAANNGTAGGT
ncbi:YbbR-like domain-containing protein [Paenibacillus puldeungensis]|uniref:YbbR-like domain-containing protein n=1 Tax=Paenibacillus puldeungensis TaxID=696536 RepID=A0ABW3S2X7_9BACL